MNVEFHQGDSNRVLDRMIANGRQVHSVICDPPYHLESVVKRFGKSGSAAAKFGSDGRFSRQSKGFMGRDWDGADANGYRIPHDPTFWRKCYDMLLPGGFCLAFSSPRTGHWQAVAMEQAGFIMHPFIGWAYSSGFPKGHAVTNLKRAEPATEWAGWAYGTQTLKPALEPIYVAQKPFSEKTGFANVLKYGVGAFNIDGCRVPTTDNLNGAAYAKNGSGRTDEWGESNGFRRDKGLEFVQPEGRWPANLIHDGSDEVTAWFPDSKGQQGDVKGNEKSSPTNGIYGKFNGRVTSTKRGDSGSAARFFNSFPSDDNGRKGEASADRRYTEKGATNFAMKPGARRTDSGSAARFFNSFPFEDHLVLYYAKASRKERVGSNHPTVKPQGLLRHLARLVTPVGGVVLDPFAGSGSMAQAALDEGMGAVLIEREPDYAEFIRHRFDLPIVDAAVAAEYLAAIMATIQSRDTMELV